MTTTDDTKSILAYGEVETLTHTDEEDPHAIGTATAGRTWQFRKKTVLTLCVLVCAAAVAGFVAHAGRLRRSTTTIQGDDFIEEGLFDPTNLGCSSAPSKKE